MYCYFVLYGKDQNELLDKSLRALYYRQETFSKLDEAIDFANSVLREQPILIKANSSSTKGKREQLKSLKKPYIIVAAHLETSPLLPKYRIVNCAKTKLEQTLENEAKAKPTKLYWGIELKYLPS